MNFKRILCPVDFSDPNQSVNEFASMVAHSNGATIVYLHVALPDVSFDSYSHVDLKKETVQDQARLEEIKPTMEGIKAAYVVEFGSPASKIVEYANENDIDLIVIGTHGRTGLRRIAMGSVAESVVRKANCPVMAIKPDSRVAQSN